MLPPNFGKKSKKVSKKESPNGGKGAANANAPTRMLYAIMAILMFSPSSSSAPVLAKISQTSVAKPGPLNSTGPISALGGVQASPTFDGMGQYSSGASSGGVLACPTFGGISWNQPYGGDLQLATGGFSNSWNCPCTCGTQVIYQQPIQPGAWYN